MNRLLKALGFRTNRFDSDDFSVRIESVAREVVSVVYERNGRSINMSGQRIGRKWEGIEVQVPDDVGAAQIATIVTDLKIAFAAMRYGYVIVRNAGMEIIPEAERQGALNELQAMGYEIEILPDGKIRQTRKAGAPRQDIDTLRMTTPRMMWLIQSLHGKRRKLEILAKSKEF